MSRRPRRPGGVTIKDVASAAGVSTATASRVVRGEAHVRPEKIEAVMAAVRELGYVPNSAARSLVERRVGAIALAFAEREGKVFTDPFFGTVVAGATAVADQNDMQLLLVMTGGDPTGDRMLRFVRGNHCDGLILASQHEKGVLDAVLDELTVPTISIGRPTQGRDMPHVDLDNEKGGRLVAEHLLARGYRRIAVIGGPTDMAAGLERERGLRTVLAEHGLEPVVVEHGDYSFASGVQAAESILGGGHDIDALFAVNDLMALAAMQRVRLRGLRIPEDIAIMGFDNIDVARAEANELTTVSNPVTEMATVAATHLLRMIDGEDVERRTLFEPTLVVRGSV